MKKIKPNLKQCFTPVLDFEIEPLDTSDWGEEFNKKSLKLTRKMSNFLKIGRIDKQIKKILNYNHIKIGE